MAACVNLSSPTTNWTPEAAVEDRGSPYVHYAIMKISIPVVCAFGILGNLLNLVVLTREKLHRILTKMEKSAHLGLIALALSDLLFCLLVFIVTMLPSSSNGYPVLTYLIYVDLIGGPIISIFILTSTWLIVCMAGERYLAVCHPFRARKVISLHRTKLILTLIFVFCALFSIPLFLENVISRRTCPNNATLYFIESRSGYTDSLYSARRLVWSIVADFIPCLSLFFFNVCLIVHIQKAKKLRMTIATTHSSNGSSPKHWNITAKDERSQAATSMTTMPTSQYAVANLNCKSSETRALTQNVSRTNTPSRSSTVANVKVRSHDSAFNSVTATLMAIVLLFLVLVSPSEILKFASCTSRTACKDNETFKLMVTVTRLMQVVNFSVNFILYCAISQSFRETLRDILCFWNTDRDDYNSSIVLKPTRKTQN